jgi:hypothetical protein
MLPGVGPIAASSAVLLNTIARLKITSVAPTNDYVWSVQKVASVQRDGLLQGVKWTVSKSLLENRPTVGGTYLDLPGQNAACR